MKGFNPLSFLTATYASIYGLFPHESTKNKGIKTKKYFFPCQALVCRLPIYKRVGPTLIKCLVEFGNFLFYISLFGLSFLCPRCHIFSGYALNRLPRFNLCPVGALCLLGFEVDTSLWILTICFYNIYYTKFLFSQCIFLYGGLTRAK